MSRFKKLTTIAAVAALAIGLAACGGNGDDPVAMPDPPDPTAFQMAQAAIAGAMTAADAQAAYDGALDDVSGSEGAALLVALNNRLAELATAARAMAQMNALTMAAGGIDTSDLSTPQAIADANTAIAALKAAIAAAVDVADTSMYQTMVDNAEAAVMTAQGHLDTQGRMMAQRMAISNAVTMARTAVNGVNDDSTDSEVASADSAIAALQDAIDNAADLPDGDADVAEAQGTHDTLVAQLNTAKTSRQAVLDDAAEERAKQMAALGRAMRGALGGAAADTNALANIAAHSLAATGTMPLSIDAVLLRTGDSAGSLGGWAGTDYARTTGTGDAMVTNEARVYVNKGPARNLPFSDTETNGRYTIITTEGPTMGYVLLGEAATPVTRARAPAFEHSGTQSHQIPSESDAFYVSGTYDGASGRFRCTGTCSSTNDGEAGPSALAGTWHFKPNAGAMVSEADAQYLYYGWWVSKDNEGDPTAASAFAGRVGTDSGDSTDGLDNAWTGAYTAGTTLTGSASYAGHAAGKFALSNPLDGTGNGGHFTADAELNATFSGAATVVGVTGTIDNFRLNDGSDDPGWSVALHRAGFGSDGAISAPEDDATTAAVDESMGTTWSIGDSSTAGRSGTWSGNMYDEAVTGDANDGSNIPTTVTGTFYSEFSSIGRMVGAFGADKQ